MRQCLQSVAVIIMLPAIIIGFLAGLVWGALQVGYSICNDLLDLLYP